MNKTDLDERLDNALAATFPCSDPFSFETTTSGDRQPITNTADKSRPPSSNEAKRELPSDRNKQ